MEIQIAEGRTAVAVHKQNKPALGVTFEDNIMHTSSLCQPCSILSNNFFKRLENNMQQIKNIFIFSLCRSVWGQDLKCCEFFDSKLKKKARIIVSVELI